jgi:hypothetical protein
VAGILFAVLYSAGLSLIRLAIPADWTAGSSDWLEANARAIELALNLVPYAGIAFLWFIGVIRDHLGDVEDRLFVTIFLGSGLLFLALTFMGAAMASGLLSSYAVAPDIIVEGGVFTYGREVMFRVINVYAIRMAGVFMITLGTIWMRTGLMHRGWTVFTYALALMVALWPGLCSGWMVWSQTNCYQISLIRSQLAQAVVVDAEMVSYFVYHCMFDLGADALEVPTADEFNGALVKGDGVGGDQLVAGGAFGQGNAVVKAEDHAPSIQTGGAVFMGPGPVIDQDFDILQLLLEVKGQIGQRFDNQCFKCFSRQAGVAAS